MSQQRVCSECGTELPHASTEGICAKCLLKAGLDQTAHGIGVDSEAISFAPSDTTDSEITLDSSAQSAEPNVKFGSEIHYFGDYELLEEIARGGMGVVYKARQVSLNRTVALKMILSGQLASEEDVARFHAEAEAAAQLDHPGIVPIHEVGEYEGQHYFSMGFVDGGSLGDRLKDDPLPPREAAEIVKKIAESIAYAHDKGVIHRDLKPGNVLLDSNEEPKVTDFGLAKRVEGDSELTATGQILGTPSYMPPEQAAGGTNDVTEAADVYSLGAILYALLTGRAPFQSGNSIDTLLQVLNDEPISPRALNGRIHKDIETICLKCLSKTPSLRYPSADALAADLDRFANGEPIKARPIGMLARTWRWCKRKPAIATLIALLLAGSFVATYQTFRAVNATRSAQAEALGRRMGDYADGLRQIQSALGRSDFTRADTLLRSIDAELQGWEYQYLSANFSRCLTRLTPLVGRQGFVGYSGDVLVGVGDRISLWDVRRRQLIFQFEDGGAYAALDPKGDRLACATGFHVQVYDLRDHKVLESFKSPAKVSAIDWSPNGERIALGTGRDVSILSVDNGTLVQWRAHTHAVTSLRFNPMGDSIVSGASNGTLSVWSIAGKRQKTLQAHTRSVNCIAFSADGRFVASCSDEVLVSESDGNTTVRIDQGGIGCLAFSPDGSLACGGRGDTIMLYNPKSGELLAEMSCTTFEPSSIAFSPDGERLAIADLTRTKILRVKQDEGFAVFDVSAVGGITFATDGHLRILSHGKKGQRRHQVADGHHVLHARAVSSDGRRMAEQVGNRLIFVETLTGQRVSGQGTQPDTIRCATYNATASVVASGSTDGAIMLWDTSDGRIISNVNGHNSAVVSLAFCPNDRYLASASHDHRIRLWDAASGKPIRTFWDDNATSSWHVEGKKQLEERVGSHKDSVYSIGFNAKGTLLISGSNDRLAKVWKVPSGRVCMTLVGHTSAVTSVAFHPDGTRIATASVDKSVRIWDTTTGEQLLELEGYVDRKQFIAFSVDGRQLACASRDKVKLWSATDLDPSRGETVLNELPDRSSGRIRSRGF